MAKRLRHKVLILASQVRILVPQPFFFCYIAPMRADTVKRKRPLKIEANANDDRMMVFSGNANPQLAKISQNPSKHA